MPRVSVIIPSYNCALFVAKAVDSVLAQTMQDCELIVVDDGSSDNTQEVLHRYFDHPRFRYIYQENRGLSGARNSGAQASEAEYLAFLDADDALAPEALELMTAEVARCASSWCLTDIIKVNGELREVQRTVMPGEDFLYWILKEDFVRRGMFFKRKDFVEIGLYDQNIQCREDWDINIRMFENRKPFVYLNQPLYVYTRREGSLTTGDETRVMIQTEKLLRKHHKRLADSGDHRVAKIYAYHMWGLARHYFYALRDYKRAFSCVRESLAYDLDLQRMFHPLVHQLRRFPAND